MCFTYSEVEAIQIMGGVCSTDPQEPIRKLDRFMALADAIREDRQRAILNSVATIEVAMQGNKSHC